MADAAYGPLAAEYAAEYAAQARTDSAAAPTVLALATRHLLTALGDPHGQRALDLGCGEEHVARRVQAAGAQVTGLDLSAELLGIARHRGSGIDYVRAVPAASSHSTAQRPRIPPRSSATSSSAGRP